MGSTAFSLREDQGSLENDSDCGLLWRRGEPALTKGREGGSKDESLKKSKEASREEGGEGGDIFRGGEGEKK